MNSKITIWDEARANRLCNAVYRSGRGISPRRLKKNPGEEVSFFRKRHTGGVVSTYSLVDIRKVGE